MQPETMLIIVLYVVLNAIFLNELDPIKLSSHVWALGGVILSRLILRVEADMERSAPSGRVRVWNNHSSTFELEAITRQDSGYTI